MQKFQDTVLDKNGRPVVGATIAVTTFAGAATPIYAINSPVTPLTSLVTDATGSFAFYAPDGRYTITITGNNFPTRTITDILLEDPIDDIIGVSFSSRVNVSGNGSTTTFDMGASPGLVNNVDVYINGIYQNKDTFSLVGTSIVFSEPPPSGTDNVEILLIAATPSTVSAIGASAVTFAPAGGLSATNAQAALAELDSEKVAKGAELVSVKNYGAVGNGVADDTVAVQAAINAGLRVLLGTAGDNYKITAPIVLRTGQIIIGGGATLTQGTANTEILNTEGKSNIDISGVVFVGLGTDYSESDSNRGVAVYGSTSGANIAVHHNTFTNFGYTPARFAGQSNCSFAHNIVVGPGAAKLTATVSGRNYGVLFDVGCVGAVVADNTISGHAQGVRIEGTTLTRVTGNRIFDIVGQHGIYAGSGLTQLVIADNIITNTDLCGIKVQTADAASVDNTGITITGNSVDDAGDQGILVCSGDNGGVGSRVRKCRGVTVSGNVVRNATGNGIKFDNTLDATVTGNTVRSPAQGGVVWDDCEGMVIADNLLRSCGRTALRDVVASSYITVRDNTVIDPATTNTASDDYGILIAGGSEYVIDGNVITSANAFMDYGIFIIGDINATLTLTRNVVYGAASTGLRLSATTALREYRGNNFNGAAAATFNDPVLAAVASANTLTLPTVHDVVRVTGTTRVDNITTNGQSGRRATLVFDDIVRFVHGNNLRLAGAADFYSTTTDTITLACDGSLWYEVARSVN